MFSSEDLQDIETVPVVGNKCIGVPKQGRTKLLFKAEDKLLHHSCYAGAGEIEVMHINISSDTPLYIEGYQVLSGLRGVPGILSNTGRIDEHRDYNFPGLDSEEYDSGVREGFNFAVFAGENSWHLVGVLSAKASLMRIRADSKSLSFIWVPALNYGIDEEHTDYIAVITGCSKPNVLKKYGEMVAEVNKAHKACSVSGWCSWYACYESVTPSFIERNIKMLQKNFPETEYILIDDGYEPHIGDWHLPSSSFPNGISEVLKKVKKAGFIPAIWTSPFIAGGESEIFKQHPDWFIQGDNKSPLSADKVTYGGWRDLPWYMLDAGIPEVQHFLTDTFLKFREEGVAYFKLDAVYWGGIPWLNGHDKNISPAERIRLGLKAIKKGVGQDAFILGCNAPLLPCAGLVDGMRLSDDVFRDAERIEQICAETINRYWSWGSLFAADPDCLVTAPLHDGESFAKSSVRLDYALAYAAGGVFFLGDDANRIIFPAGIQHLHKMLKDPGEHADFINNALTIAVKKDKSIVVFGGRSGETIGKYAGMKMLFRGGFVAEDTFISAHDAEILIKV